MADLLKLQQFAADHGFGLTAPLTHAQASALADYWLPDMRFYEDERFHPIALDDMLTMVEGLFAQLPASAQDQWRVPKLIRTATTSGVIRVFDPPVVYRPDGSIPVGQNQWRQAFKVLNDGSPAADALSLPEANGDTFISHGASFERSMQFLGSVRTLAGTNRSSPGDPFLPRADEPDPAAPGELRSRITVMSSLINLIDLLKFELQVGAENGYPPDGMRGGFNVIDSVLHAQLSPPPPFPGDVQRKFLLDLIASHESGGSLPQPALPDGWRLDRVAWDAVTRFAFLEYSFFYAYNDFERYQTAIFDNEHEGDDEGCCLVFDRNVLNLAAATGDLDMLHRAVPHSLITSVHEEFQDADLFKFIPTPVPNPVPENFALAGARRRFSTNCLHAAKAVSRLCLGRVGPNVAAITAITLTAANTRMALVSRPLLLPFGGDCSTPATGDGVWTAARSRPQCLQTIAASWISSAQ